VKRASIVRLVLLLGTLVFGMTPAPSHAKSSIGGGARMGPLTSGDTAQSLARPIRIPMNLGSVLIIDSSLPLERNAGLACGRRG
jgi:hypothetical protein